MTEEWGEIDRGHRKVARCGFYLGRVWGSPSTFRRVLAAHGLVLPEPPRPRPAPHRLLGRNAFPRAKRVAFAILDVVSRRWIETLVSVEETTAQVQVLFDQR